MTKITNKDDPDYYENFSYSKSN